MGVSIRDFLYRRELLKGVEFNLPVISVGNLSVGGAGKSPHIEYLVRLLKDYVNVATLSRGYGRKTKGFLEVYGAMTADQVGDEPLQFKRKFPDIKVVVSESRTFAIPQMVAAQPDLQIVLLDDAFQHRSVRPGLNILLTEFRHPFTRDYLLPSGRLREWRSAYQRADIIVVSKCPSEVSDREKEALRSEIDPLPHQRLYFSYYDYFPPYYIFDRRARLDLQPDLDVLLVSAIARTEYLVEYLEPRVGALVLLEYEDHHLFSKHDVSHIRTTFDRMESDRKIILTTEKDAMRLEMHQAFLKEHRLPIFAIPVQVKFHGGGEAFDQDVKSFLLNFKA